MPQQAQRVSQHRMADNNKYKQKCVLYTLLLEMENDAIWKKICQFLKIGNIILPFDPAIPVLSIYPGVMKTCDKTIGCCEGLGRGKNGGRARRGQWGTYIVVSTIKMI